MNEPGLEPVTGRTLWIVLAAMAALGLVLRVAAANGALWLDEAWSAVFAHEVGTPAGVFFGINHDNNHHLNTLWLQLTGWGAPPLLSRALSIASGSLAVIVAGLIGARRGIICAGITAALFALSPILLTYGAEARGYAPMILALLAAILLIERRLADPESRSPARALALLGLFGTLAHLTMLYGIVALTGWVALTLLRRLSLRDAAIATLRLTGPMIVTGAAVIGLIAAAGRLSPSGFHVGSYLPFSVAQFSDGVEQMLGYSIGFPFSAKPLLIVLAAALVPLALWRMPSLRARAPFYLLAIIGLPLAIIVLRIGNSGIPRYYLVTAIAVLLMLGDVLAIAIGGTGRARRAAIVALAGMAIGATALDTTIITNRRGDPGEAIRAMAARAPGGATILLDNARDSAVLRAAAASARYPLGIADRTCPAARFLYIDEEAYAPFPARPVRCDTPYGPVTSRLVQGLSGLHWQLYERQSP